MVSSSSHSVLLFLTPYLVLSFVLPLLAAQANAGRSHFPYLISDLSKKQYEGLIRGLNISPVRDVNIVENDPLANASNVIVEKSFQFEALISGFGTNGANGTSIQEFGHHAGYFSLPETKGARMFYFFFESRSNKTDAPVVVWLSGGPGCSSSLALFYENGPFHLTDSLSLTWNDFGWDKESNLIYVDQPIGTGFSYSTSMGDIRSTSEEAGADFYNFLQAFFQKHPRYAKNDFYITGESYAGHYIPAFAAEIQRRNKNEGGVRINLKGIAIGNGLTNPVIQHKANLDFALEAKIINKSAYDDLSIMAKECEKEDQACGNGTSSMCSEAYLNCNKLFNSILSVAGNDINYYDIRKKCEGSLCYDLSNVEKFLNLESVKDDLGIRGIEFVSCSSDVQNAMAGEQSKNFAVYIPPLLNAGVKVLIYAGEYDLICNWLGNSRWVGDLSWPGKKNYSLAHWTEFIVDNTKAGSWKRSGPLTFLKIYNAGHLSPMDQPKATLEMLRRWMQGRSL